VAAAIPEESVLIEVVRVAVRPSVVQDDAAPDALRYVALRLDRDGRMDYADLGEAGVVDGLVDRWRSALQRAADDFSSEPAARELDHAAGALGSAVWRPLARLAGDARRIFFVPDGALHQVYVPALPSGGGRFQIETGPPIHVLSTGRDLARMQEPPPPGNPAMSLLALGGVTFPAGPPGPARGSVPCPSLGSLAWPPLAQSRREIDGIRNLFLDRGPILALTGAAATENRLKREAPRHTVLHLATHGFFLDDDCGGAAPNPLLLSGLVLAGAGGTGDRTAGDDGLLTAEEITVLDLSAVHLSVLSACNSGLGRVTAGEGVFGLRRALEIAGARSIVTSLWPVPDRHGRRWMTSFYTAWLAGQPMFEAARGASLNRLADLRRREATPHPFLWGGFVTAGDWRSAVNPPVARRGAMDPARPR